MIECEIGASVWVLCGEVKGNSYNINYSPYKVYALLGIPLAGFISIYKVYSS